MKSSKSGLFLMELIISILFFSLASAACIQLFVKAHLLDIRTKEQNQAVIWSQNLASLWLAADGDLYPVYEQLHADYDSESRGYVYFSNFNTSISLYFDKDWRPATEDIVYIIELTNNHFDTYSGLSNAVIAFQKNNETFYSLPISCHTAMNAGDASYEGLDNHTEGGDADE